MKSGTLNILSAVEHHSQPIESGANTIETDSTDIDNSITETVDTERSGRSRLYAVCPTHGPHANGRECKKFGELDPNGKAPVHSRYRYYAATFGEFVKPLLLIGVLCLGMLGAQYVLPSVLNPGGIKPKTSASGIAYGYYYDDAGTYRYGKLRNGKPIADDTANNGHNDSTAHNCNFDSDGDGNNDSYVAANYGYANGAVVKQCRTQPN